MKKFEEFLTEGEKSTDSFNNIKRHQLEDLVEKIIKDFNETAMPKEEIEKEAEKYVSDFLKDKK